MANGPTVQLDTSELSARLADVVQDKIPYAAANALNTIAGKVQTGLVDSMREVFDRPTSYTLNSLYIKYASTRNLEAQVRFKDATSKGTLPENFLRPQIEGGARRVKRFERALSRNIGQVQAVMSRLGVTNYFVPGAGAQLDAYGNMVRGQFAKILSQLGGQNDRYANETPASRDRREGKAVGSRKVRKRPQPRYFIAGLYRARHLAPGIWIRTPMGRGKWTVQPVLLEAREAPDYAPRFPFVDVAQSVIDANATADFEAALAAELSYSGSAIR